MRRRDGDGGQMSGERKTQFRPCIDLHEGKVKQIVGGSLSNESVEENFVSERPSSFFSKQFRADQVTGGHVIKLGPGNDDAATEALAAWPNGLQIGGGICRDNARHWIDSGASHVIVTSWLFDESHTFREDRAAALANEISPERIVIDLSCRRVDETWVVAMNRWQTLTDLEVTHETLNRLAQYCDEFLIHAADVEGKCGGIDQQLVERLGQWRKKPVTYAGGVANMADVELIQTLSAGYVDVTVGSALDIFGGKGVVYQDIVQWNQRS